jgi:hypothetical protein
LAELLLDLFDVLVVEGRWVLVQEVLVELEVAPLRVRKGLLDLGRRVMFEPLGVLFESALDFRDFCLDRRVGACWVTAGGGFRGWSRRVSGAFTTKQYAGAYGCGFLRISNLSLPAAHHPAWVR